MTHPDADSGSGASKHVPVVWLHFVASSLHPVPIYEELIRTSSVLAQVLHVHVKVAAGARIATFIGLGFELWMARPYYSAEGGEPD